MSRLQGVDPFNPILDIKESADVKKYLLEVRNWNRYTYVWNNPLNNIDPNGEDVYIISYVLDDPLQRRGAETRANELNSIINKKKDIVVLIGVSSAQDFVDKVNDIAATNWKQFGPVAELTLFSHGDKNNGPVFNDQGRLETITDAQITKINIFWTKNAVAVFMGCNVGNDVHNFAKRFRDIQEVNTWAYNVYTYPSSNRDDYVPVTATSNVYWVGTDLGDINGSRYYIAKAKWVLGRYSIVRNYFLKKRKRSEMVINNNILLLKNRKSSWLLITVGLILLGIIAWLFVNRSDPIIFSLNFGKEKLRSPFLSIYNPFRDRTQEEIAEVFLTRIENRFEPIEPHDPIPISPLLKFIDETIISKAERCIGSVPINNWYLAGKQENQREIILSYWIVSGGNLVPELCWIKFERIENKWKLIDFDSEFDASAKN